MMRTSGSGSGGHTTSVFLGGRTEAWQQHDEHGMVNINTHTAASDMDTHAQMRHDEHSCMYARLPDVSCVRWI